MDSSILKARGSLFVCLILTTKHSNVVGIVMLAFPITVGLTCPQATYEPVNAKCTKSKLPTIGSLLQAVTKQNKKTNLDLK